MVDNRKYFYAPRVICELLIIIGHIYHIFPSICLTKGICDVALRAY